MKRTKAAVLLVALLLFGTAAYAADVPIVTEPITIEIWHTRGAGANGDQIAEAVAEFNATNPHGITVVEVYQGGYVDTLAKTMQAIAAGTNPELVVLERAAGVPVLASQGVLLDMMPFAQRDGFDLGNFPEVLLGYSFYDGQLISLPYIRSTPLFYYNKALFAEAGVDRAPKTIEELIDVGRKVTKVNERGETEVYGFELLNDPAWFVQNMLYQLGSNMLSEDGSRCPALEDGTMLKVLTAWRAWVDEGWCAAPTVTNAESTMKDLFNQGKIASYFASSGGMTNILRNAEAVGIEVGVAFLPTWDKPAAPTGGGNIAIIQRNKNDQQMAAAWEFVKFLMSDEQVASNAAKTGYLPVTYTSVQTDVIKQLWEERPEYKVAFDQLEIAQELPFSPYKSEFEEAMKVVCSQLIMDRSITPELAVELLQVEASLIFP
jgi:sn-glycerol 3-phosphate transport system substrate-binding protein